MAEQITLFYPKIMFEEPNLEDSADLKYIGYDELGNKYALKTKETHPLLPITEWFCYSICKKIGILTPEYAIVQRKNGELVFGSRFDLNYHQINLSELTSVPFDELFPSYFGGDASKHSSNIFFADFFCANDDRHVRNFLFKKIGKKSTPYAFDFSRAWIINEVPFGLNSLPNDCKTVGVFELLKFCNCIQKFESLSVFEEISNLPDDFAEKTLNSAPTEWLDSKIKGEVIEYWINKRKERIKSARGQYA